LSKDTATEKIVRDYLITKALDIKVSNEASVDKRVAAATARDLLVVNTLTKSLAKVFTKNWCAPPKYTGKRLHAPHKRIVNILLSDLHFGSHLDPVECPMEYGTVQESRRLGRVAQQVADYKRQYRKETKLIVHLLGDIIQNQLHDPRDGDPLTEQFAAAVHYLTQFVLFVAANYPSVEVNCNPGNHGRNMARHPDRGVQQKWDAIETMIYLAVKMAVANSGVTNVKFNIPKTPYYIVQLFDSKGFFTHGDTVFKPGFPGNSINVKALAHQVTKWNTSRNIGGPFAIFGMGHVHTGAIITLPGNVTVITNSCLVPPDAFSLSIGSPDNTCAQWLWESVEGHAIGDQRLIVVDGAENDSSYNDFIRPYGGF
jgi:hypothetical protein